LSGGFAGNSTGITAVSKDGDQWESFKGKGETLGGRKTKGKGISHRKVEQVSENSKIIRTDQRRIVSNSTIESNVKVPAALNLPFGQLFFGFNVTTYTPPQPSSDASVEPSESPLFSGSGNTLSGRSNPNQSNSSKGKAKESSSESTHVWGTSGNTLNAGSASSQPRGAGGGLVPQPRQRIPQKEIERIPSPDWGVDDDDEDVIMIDSD